VNLRKQRLWGAALAALSGLLLALASAGATPAERDGTAALLTLALGLYLIFCKHDIIF